jgi:Ca2+-binding EF-hand superfamily protein
MFIPEQNAWIFFGDHSVGTNTAGRLAVKGANGYGDVPVLYTIENGLGRPLAIPMELDLAGGAFDPRVLRYQLFNSAGPPVQVLQPVPTAEGIAAIIPSFGFWLIPWSDLSRVLQSARAERTAEQQGRSLAVDRAWTRLQEKYRFTQRHSLRPEEKEAMIDDPGFLELELENIDANHNGKLDADELVFFDANKDKQFDAKEQAGMELTQNLLAQMLLNEFDRNRDGRLNEAEFGEFWNDVESRNSRTLLLPPNLRRFDKNGDGELSVVELETYLRQYTGTSLSPGFEPNYAARLMKQRAEALWAGGAGTPAFPPRGTSIVASPRMRTNSRPAQPSVPVTNALATSTRTPDEMLLEATAAGDTPKARSAINAGAGVDVRDDRGWTCLMIAAQAGHADVVKLLVEKGADAKALSTSKIGATVLCFATDSDRIENTRNALNFMRSANAPVMSAGVMIANVIWNAMKSWCGIVVA